MCRTLHFALLSPPFQPMQVSVDGILSSRLSPQHSESKDLSEGPPSLTIETTDEDIAKHWSQHRLLKETNCHQSPSGHRSVDHYQLDAIIQPISYALGNPAIISVSFQLTEKEFVANCVTAFTEFETDNLLYSNFKTALRHYQQTHHFCPALTEVPK